MKTKTTILIVFVLTFLSSYGQKVQTSSYEQDVQIKKETKIVHTFDYDYIKGGELYLLKKGSDLRYIQELMDIIRVSNLTLSQIKCPSDMINI